MHDEFTAEGAVILGVSTDPVERNARFAQKFGFPFLLLSDTQRKICLAYGACSTPEDKSAKRISYLIGPDGKVLKAYPKVKAAEHPAQVLADLRALKAGA